MDAGSWIAGWRIVDGWIAEDGGALGVGIHESVWREEGSAVCVKLCRAETNSGFPEETSSILYWLILQGVVDALKDVGWHSGQAVANLVD